MLLVVANMRVELAQLRRPMLTIRLARRSSQLELNIQEYSPLRCLEQIARTIPRPVSWYRRGKAEISCHRIDRMVRGTAEARSLGNHRSEMAVGDATHNEYQPHSQSTTH